MVVFNYSSRELTTKVVYYGPGLCGKTTNLQFIYDSMPPGVKGKMLSLATKSDRTLFFDFLPIDLGEIGGMKTKVQLYTVPGQVFYNETRRLVLKGADGVVFVADSQEDMMDANKDSFRNLEENLQGHGLELAALPHVLQFNKRDLPNALGVDSLNEALNDYNVPFYEAVATQGIGVQETLRHITKLVLVHLNERYGEKRRKSHAAGGATGAARQQEPAAEAPPQATPVSDPSPAEPAAEPAEPMSEQAAEQAAEQDVSAGLGFAFGDEPEPQRAEQGPPLAMPAEPEAPGAAAEEPPAAPQQAASAEDEPPLAMPGEPEPPAQVDPEAELGFAFGDEPEPQRAEQEPPLAMPAEPEEPGAVPEEPPAAPQQAASAEDEPPLAMPPGPEPEGEVSEQEIFSDPVPHDDAAAPLAGEGGGDDLPLGDPEPWASEPAASGRVAMPGSPEPAGHGGPRPQGSSGSDEPPPPPPLDTPLEAPEPATPAAARASDAGAPGDEPLFGGEPLTDTSPPARGPSPMPLDTEDILGVGESLAEASVAVAVEEEPEESDVFRVAPAVGIGSTQQIDRSELNEALGADPPDASGGIAAQASAVEVDAADPLFAEPGVEPTRLSTGVPQEILVPLELEVGGEIHRYRLVLKLQLDR
jgi:hypothetical protein